MGDTSEQNKLSHAELKKVYETNANVLRFCKEKLGNSATNEQAAIMHAYELQAGTYIDMMVNNPGYREKKIQFGKVMAEIIAPYKPTSILEAGVGEATSLAEVMKNLPAAFGQDLYAFDLSWSRLLMGSRYFHEQAAPRRCHFFAGELEHIALPDNAFDVVFTAHAVEPNHGREKQILEELYRVTAGQLIMVEPGYDLAGPAARERMEFHGYCRGLADIARANGWHVARHELLAGFDDSANPSMILIIEKNEKVAAPSRESSEARFISPVGGGPLTFHNGHYFNQEEGLVYPVIGGIPFLTSNSALLATHFAES